MKILKCRVLAIDYRLAPEHPYPAALNDAIATYHWLINSQGINPRNIIIEGLSAGGGLTLACLLKLRDEGDPLPAAAISLSPYADLALTGESYTRNAGLDVISLESSKFNAPLYYGENDPKNPYISPCYGDFKNFPPLFIQSGTSDVLHDDAIRVSKCAQNAGIDYTIDIWEDLVHAFQIFAPYVPESKSALEKISEFTGRFFK